MSSILYNTHMRKVMYIVAINACARDSDLETRQRIQKLTFPKGIY